MSASSPERSDPVVLGRLGKPHGLYGELRFFPYGCKREIVEAIPEITVGNKILKQIGLRGEGSFWLIRFEGISSREDAARLAGQLACVDYSRLPELPEMEFYEADLIGASVEDMQGRSIGVIDEIMAQPEHDVLVIHDASGRECLIPTLNHILKSWNRREKKLIVDWYDPDEGVDPAVD